MKKQKLSLSPEDRKAVDAVCDHAAHAGSSQLTRLTNAVSPQRVAAVNKLLHLLDAMPPIDPPKNLVARTMARIDQSLAENATRRPQIALLPSAHLH